MVVITDAIVRAATMIIKMSLFLVMPVISCTSPCHDPDHWTQTCHPAAFHRQQAIYIFYQVWSDVKKSAGRISPDAVTIDYHLLFFLHDNRKRCPRTPAKFNRFACLLHERDHQPDPGQPDIVPAILPRAGR
jgi:hypothetical protein